MHSAFYILHLSAFSIAFTNFSKAHPDVSRVSPNSVEKAYSDMVFSGLIFLLAFLPANLILYFSAKTIKARNIILLVFSLIFYAWGEPVYVFILMLMAWLCWFFSQLIEKSRNRRAKRTAMIMAAVVCIGAIGYFKYIGFFVENINSLFGKELLPVPEVALPIGISFYTFQLLTYVIDVYRGEVPAQKYYWKVLLYAGLFHQCVAGPIVRYGDVENELTERVSDLDGISTGITRFCFGLAKKSILANSCGAVVDTLLLTDSDIGTASLLAQNLSIIEGRSALTLWMGMAFYMLQIYLDFSAYSDMAIGMGLICGFHYKENFHYPYCSHSVTEFWRNWHMSLGSFFRDYVYIPLGGNRKGKARQIFNMFVVWALTGLWHGASWNFVLWGLYFFVCLVIEKTFLGKFFDKHRGIGVAVTLAVVYFGWIFFKFTDMSLVGAVLKGMFCLNGNKLATYESLSFAGGYILFFILAVFACTPLAKNIGTVIRKKGKYSNAARIAASVGDIAIPACLFILSVLSLVGDSYNPFLYYQF